MGKHSLSMDNTTQLLKTCQFSCFSLAGCYANGMRILHSSDWHLGARLYGRVRGEEHAAFLRYLLDVMKSECVDVLLLAGDVFDSANPTTASQTLYYEFLAQVAQSGCRHVVVVAGNHDSPSFLAAPQALLLALKVHVVASMSEDIEDELLTLCDAAGNPELLVAAVPYLRDKDLRRVEAGESTEDKQNKLLSGMKLHYEDLARLGEARRAELLVQGHADIPFVAMGHLFAAGALTHEGDGVRDLHVGTLLRLGGDAFPSCFDYVALGHLHMPQMVAGLAHVRYSGAPLPMSFAEAEQVKTLMLLDFEGRNLTLSELPIPCFMPLLRVEGDLDEILAEIASLRAQGMAAFLELEYTGADLLPDLRERVEAALEGSSLDLLALKNRVIAQRALNLPVGDVDLEDVDEWQIFDACLLSNKLPDEQCVEMRALYRELRAWMEEQERELRCLEESRLSSLSSSLVEKNLTLLVDIALDAQ